MINSKLIEVLRSFDGEDRRRFRDFLRSPFFTRSAQLAKLCDELATFAPDYTDESLTFKYLYGRMYHGRKYRESTMLNLFSDLLELAERFLSETRFEKNIPERYNSLLKELTDRSLPGTFEKAVKDYEGEYFGRMKPDTWYFWDKYRLEVNKYNFVLANDKILRRKELNAETGHLVKAFVNLVNYFVTDATTYYLNLNSYASEYSIERIADTSKKLIQHFNIGKLSEILGELNEDRYVLEIYEKLFKAFEDFEDEKKYFDYKKTLNKCIHRLSEDEISFHLYKMIAYCIIKVNRGDSEQHNFNEELSSIYNLMLENKYYVDKKFDFMHHDLFRAILLHGLGMKNFNWTRNFVEKYSDEVHPKMKKDMRNLGYAYLNFASRDLEKALKYVNKIPQDYFILKYDVKNLLLRIHTELGNINTALDLMHSYKEVLRNDRMISQERGKGYKNFLRFLEKLLLKQAGKKRIDMDYFFDRLRKETNAAFKDWLVEKYETYLGKVKRTG